MFLGFLAPYEPDEIIKAFEKYVASRAEFPTPADIIAIMKGRIKRDQAYYKTLLIRRREGVFLIASEHRYIRKYEEQTLNDWE